LVRPGATADGCRGGGADGEEDEELEVGDIDADGEHVHRDDHRRLGAVAELADALERSGRASSRCYPRY